MNIIKSRHCRPLSCPFMYPFSLITVPVHFCDGSGKGLLAIDGKHIFIQASCIVRRILSHKRLCNILLTRSLHRKRQTYFLGRLLIIAIPENCPLRKNEGIFLRRNKSGHLYGYVFHVRIQVRQFRTRINAYPSALRCRAHDILVESQGN